MERHTKDIHYELRASERDAEQHGINDIRSTGIPVEKRKRFWRKREKDIRAFLYYGQVHILSPDLKKRITVVPYSKRKWRFIVK